MYQFQCGIISAGKLQQKNMFGLANTGKESKNNLF